MLKYSEIRAKIDFEKNNGYYEELAHFTHYIQNHRNGVSQHFKKKAVNFYTNNIAGINCVGEPELQQLLPLKFDVPFPPPENPEFTFIDLFAGIGGFRIPLQELGGQCVFSSEYDYYARRAYEMNFGEVPFGDITELDLELVPKHDMLCAGFPCQPFSISGKLKGFEDTRGTLIYYVFRIIERRFPKVVLLENVKHLLYLDKKRTLKTIIKHLEELGYNVSFNILNASDFGVPQNRERIIIVGSFEKKFNFDEIGYVNVKPKLKDFLDKKNNYEYIQEPYTILEDQKLQDSGLIFAGYRNKKIRKAGVRPNTEYLSRVHKQPNRIYSTEGIHPALPSQESSGRFWIYHNGKVRKLTISECYRIMGFPGKFKLINSRGELYKQIGNSVCIPMVKELGRQVIKQLLKTW